MSGYKTWIAVIGALALSVYYFLNGQFEQAVQWLTFALGLLGIGHKIEKNARL